MYWFYGIGKEFVKYQAAHTINMIQTNYIEEFMKRLNMENYKSIGTSLDANVKLMKLSNEEYHTNTHCMANVPYKSVVGSFMHAMTATRANLPYTITVNQHMSKPW